MMRREIYKALLLDVAMALVFLLACTACISWGQDFGELMKTKIKCHQENPGIPLRIECKTP